MAENPVFDMISKDVQENKVMLYMKGTPDQPMCGFSAATVATLKRLGIPFAARNVLADEALRQGIKDFSNWPTIPQLYVNGEFVGGNDIVQQMAASGDLAKMAGV